MYLIKAVVRPEKRDEVMIIMAVKDADKDDIVSVIMRTAKTSEKGAFGDGKIFVSPLEEAYTVSTGAKEL